MPVSFVSSAGARAHGTAMARLLQEIPATLQVEERPMVITGPQCTWSSS